MYTIYLYPEGGSEMQRQFPSIPNKGDTVSINCRYYVVENVEFQVLDPLVYINVFLKEKAY